MLGCKPCAGLDSSCGPDPRLLQGARVKFEGGRKAGTRAPALCRGPGQAGEPRELSWGRAAHSVLPWVQKKSREESSGEGSGVEILANRPYTDGPGGSGQYTHKVYHVGSHIPGWFRALLPKAALQVEEESWNAYPYTRTR